MIIDYRGLHQDVCAMRNKVAWHLSGRLFKIPEDKSIASIPLDKLQAFERECREFIEKVWPYAKGQSNA